VSRSALFVALAALAVAACMTPKPPRELVQAQRLEHAGDDAAALPAYERAITSCTSVEDPLLRQTACGQAYSGRAATLARLGKPDDALAAWLDMARALATLAPEDAARALQEAAVLELERSHDKAAYDLFWRVIVEHPEAAAADDALRVVVRDGRTRNARELDGVLASLYERQKDSELADNLLADRADLAEHELAQPRAALVLWDQIATRWPKGPFYDDARWNGARLARAGGDPKGALTRLHQLLATKEEAFMIGSYHSVFLDDAELEAGRILRDDLNDPRAALVEFDRLENKDYKDSVLRDDALFEAAMTHAALGEKDAACARLASLRKHFPDSKFLLEPPPALAGCPAATAPAAVAK
jgi:tetratricopeptide (TPR) repeat protein